MRISDWSSDVCSSDLAEAEGLLRRHHRKAVQEELFRGFAHEGRHRPESDRPARAPPRRDRLSLEIHADDLLGAPARQPRPCLCERREVQHRERSEEHTSELQSLMRISYAVFCLQKQNNKITMK